MTATKESENVCYQSTWSFTGLPHAYQQVDLQWGHTHTHTHTHTFRWARQGAPRRGTGRCASPGWSGRSWGCRRWLRGTPSSEPPPRPAWWHAGTGSRTAPGPRTPSPAFPRSTGRTKSTGCAWCTSARWWTCARCRAAWTCWRKLRWEPAACSPCPPSPLWDPLRCVRVCGRGTGGFPKVAL